jgi:hypothetical protein
MMMISYWTPLAIQVKELVTEEAQAVGIHKENQPPEGKKKLTPITLWRRDAFSTTSRMKMSRSSTT